MDTVLRNLTYDVCLLYLNNVILRAPPHFTESVRAVPRSPPDTQPGKLSNFTERSKGFREYCSPEGISTDPEKLKAVPECPTPKNKQEIRSLLGLCTYYTPFISLFRQHPKTAEQTYGKEAGLPVDSGG
jgi:hypothetical protein